MLILHNLSRWQSMKGHILVFDRRTSTTPGGMYHPTSFRVMIRILIKKLKVYRSTIKSTARPFTSSTHALFRRTPSLPAHPTQKTILELVYTGRYHHNPIHDRQQNITTNTPTTPILLTAADNAQQQLSARRYPCLRSPIPDTTRYDTVPKTSKDVASTGSLPTHVSGSSPTVWMHHSPRPFPFHSAGAGPGPHRTVA